MVEAGPAPDVLAQAVVAFRTRFSGVTLRQAIAFLYVCENEGLTLRELSIVARLSAQTASRAVKALEGRRNPTCIRPLVEAAPSGIDRRALSIRLTTAGAGLRDELEAAIAQRPLIDLPGAGADDRNGRQPRLTRNSVLACFELLWELHPDLSLTDILVLLVVAEHALVRISEIALFAEVAPITASRSLRLFLDQDSRSALAPALGVTETVIDMRDGRSLIASLSPKGVDLIRALNGRLAVRKSIM
jgi:DNA-binding MarR family transcriptional regulator